MCLYPRMIINPKYRRSKKNGGLIPPVKDERTLYVPIGCLNCIECRKQKARGWQIRLLEEIKTAKNGKFITLTFNNESIKELIEKDKELKGYETDNAIATKAIRRFLERWRKKYKKSVRHWLITELGHNGTENIHLHGIIWTEKSYEEIKEIWKYGYIYPRTDSEIKANYVNARTINYIIKYINKIDEKHKTYTPKILTSAGIGSNYTNTYNSKTNKYNGTETRETYRTETGHKIGLPIYYRNKIYTEEEREKLWIIRLDKNERWVNKERIDISKDFIQYEKAVAYAREWQKQFGYKGIIKYDQKKYEMIMRNINIRKRLEK